MRVRTCAKLLAAYFLVIAVVHLPFILLRLDLFVAILYRNQIAWEAGGLMDSLGSPDPKAPTTLEYGDPRIPEGIGRLNAPRTHVWRDQLMIYAGRAGAVIVYREPHRAGRREWRINDRVFWHDARYAFSPE